MLEYSFLGPYFAWGSGAVILLSLLLISSRADISFFLFAALFLYLSPLLLFWAGKCLEVDICLPEYNDAEERLSERELQFSDARGNSHKLIVKVDANYFVYP